ncbi:MAG: oligosaccharide flippase family protein, partial [Gammaproteobacteria bacterium]|nr:oligosaccharide flippase family protein [Gammaproteobacteria bacterium]
MGAGFTGLVVSIAAYAVIRLVVYSYIVKSDVLPVSRATLKECFVREQLSYSLPLALSAIVGLVGRVLDRMVIAVNFTTNQFAVYSVGALELPLDAIFQKSVANVLRATFPPLVKEKKFAEIIEIWRASVRKLALVVLPTFVFLLFFSYEFITLLFTEEYAESVGIFRGYLLLVPLHMFVFSVIPPVFGKTAVTFKISLAIVAINVVLSLILVKLIGFYGPVIGTVVSAYAGVAMYLVVDMRLLQCTVSDLIPARSILMTLLVSVLAGSVGLLVNGMLSDPFVRLLVCGAVYFVTFLVFARVFNVLQGADIVLIRRFIVKLPLVGRYAK